MASVPDKTEVKKLKRQSAGADKRKLATQEKEGKTFEQHGQGVIPEAVWQNLPGKKAEAQNG